MPIEKTVREVEHWHLMCQVKGPATLATIVVSVPGEALTMYERVGVQFAGNSGLSYLREEAFWRRWARAVAGDETVRLFLVDGEPGGAAPECRDVEARKCILGHVVPPPGGAS